jgi:citronellol/citronellal dehydrogenase
MSLRNKTLFITGASRGIGLAIALRAAKDGANIVVAAKTTEAHPKLPGTIKTAAEAIERAGGRALPIALDIRNDSAVLAAAKQAADTFGGIDILVNNASAISLTGTLATPMKRFDLMFAVNVRGTYCCSQACIPYLRQASNPHILTLAPPLDMRPKWFKDHVAYTIAKYGMSMCVLGMAEEFRADGIAVNALWPRTIVATAALRLIPGVRPEMARKPEILADSAYIILNRDSRTFSGNFCIDEDVLASEGVSDLDGYAFVPGVKNLVTDLFLD